MIAGFPLLSADIIDTSIIHDTLAVIANEVKQSSKTKMHFFKPSGLPRRLRLCRASLAAEALLHNDEAPWIPRIRGNDVPVY